MEPVPPFRRGPSGEIELPQGAVFLLLAVGIAFVLIGVYLALGFLRIVPVNDEFGKPVSSSITLIACACFLVVGGTFTWGRRSVTFDLARQTVTRQYSLAVPIRRVQRRISEFDAVIVVFWKGNTDTPDRYSVQLRATVGKNFKICSSTDQGQSRRHAAFLASALHLPLAE
jgi:hypothetical protein